MVMKLRKKPVEVEGVRWTGDNLDELRDFVGSKLRIADGNPIIETLEGDHDVIVGAVVVRGVAGEFYPVAPDIFQATFVVEDAVMLESLNDSTAAAPMDAIPYLLNQGAEEACELGQAFAKALRFGLDSVNPENDESSRHRIQSEANDVLGLVYILNQELISRGMAPIDGIGDQSRLDASVSKRIANLSQEYAAGRFSLPIPPTKEA